MKNGTELFFPDTVWTKTNKLSHNCLFRDCACVFGRVVLSCESFLSHAQSYDSEVQGDSTAGERETYERTSKQNPEEDK